MDTRTMFLAAFAFAAAIARVGYASAQIYPSRPVRVVVGSAAGGGVDIIARLMGQWLSERLGQQFVIENRPGAGTNIGTEAVAKGAAGRAHTPACQCRQCDQRNSLREAQF